MLFGILTQKRNPSGFKWVNRYYVQVDSSTQALEVGVLLANKEQQIHGSQCEFYNVHAWRPFQTPNVKYNQPIFLQGDLSVSNPIKPEIVARYFLAPNDGGNLNYKDYRVQVEGSSLNGYVWASGMLTALSEFATSMADMGDYLVNVDNGPLTPGLASTEYHFRQLSKAWYNRAS